MLGRRRDIQIPKTPNSSDKATQNWMTAVGAMLNKYIGGGSDDRLVSAKELFDSGVVGLGSGGVIAPPAQNLTKPPKVTGLQANGALASIIVQWVNPVFVNYAYTELWRADVDDVGQAFLIARTQVESYIDNVGSAATKYYWARAVSNAGVKGEFNGAAGVKGQTSYDPEYVKGLLTASKWKANTAYAPYQYVQPTTENGFQYMVVDGGVSGSTEPTWPVVVNDVVNDATVQWITISDTARLPFVIGTQPNGDPAVFIDTAFIKDATITSAKITNLIADKIETGDLNADLHVLQKLWYGFNQPNGDYINPETLEVTHGNSGFYFGVSGSNPALPIFHINTGIANGSRQLLFDGEKIKLEKVDVVSSADGRFDDLASDSLTSNRIYAKSLGFGELFATSEYVQLDVDGRPIISGDTFDPSDYYCWINGCVRTQSSTSRDFIAWNILSGTKGIRYQTTEYTDIVPYDYPDSSTKYRFKKKAISFKLKIGGFGLFFIYSTFRIYIFDAANGFPLNTEEVSAGDAIAGYSGQYLAKIDFSGLILANGSYDFKRQSGEIAFSVDVVTEREFTNKYDEYDKYASSFIISCDTDNEMLEYTGGRRIKIGIEYRRTSVISGMLNLDFQMIDKAVHYDASNDPILEYNKVPIG